MKHRGKPKRKNAITKDARAVPTMDPLPPVESVPPKTTAVMISIVKSAPRSDFAVPRYAVSTIPAMAADNALNI